MRIGDVAAVSALVFMLALCGTGLGLALSMLVKSENQGMAFTQLLVMGGAVLGGLWFPVDRYRCARSDISRRNFGRRRRSRTLSCAACTSEIYGCRLSCWRRSRWRGSRLRFCGSKLS